MEIFNQFSHLSLGDEHDICIVQRLSLEIPMFTSSISFITSVLIIFQNFLKKVGSLSGPEAFFGAKL